MAFAVADKPQTRADEVRPQRTTRVALVQASQAIGTETFDPRDDNLDKALSAIDRAASDEADVVVFGEMHLSGYRTDEWLYRWATTVSPRLADEGIPIEGVMAYVTLPRTVACQHFRRTPRHA